MNEYAITAQLRVLLDQLAKLREDLAETKQHMRENDEDVIALIDMHNAEVEDVKRQVRDWSLPKGSCDRRGALYTAPFI
jgi:hypothetical protein